MKLTAQQSFLRDAIQSLLALVGNELALVYFVYDGALGHNAGVQLTRQCGLHLISKLRHDSALYLPHEGPYPGRGPRRKYGPRLDYDQLPAHCLRDSFQIEFNFRDAKQFWGLDDFMSVNQRLAISAANLAWPCSWSMFRASCGGNPSSPGWASSTSRLGSGRASTSAKL